MAEKLQLRFALTKVDARQRRVTGVMIADEDDKSGEACDYITSKPYFEEWSAEINKSSGGKSLGNVRAMHQPIAAGKVVLMDFDDAAKLIRIEAEIIDDAEWNKCLEGVYTGFSIGGDYVKRWTDPATRRRKYTAEPHEVSLVDNPCVPSATFTAVKLDGSTELRKFVENTPDGETTEGAAVTPLAGATEALEDAQADHDPTVAVPTDIIQKLHNDIVGLGAPCTGASRWYDPDESELLASDPGRYLMQQIHAQLCALGAQCPERVQRDAAGDDDLTKAGAAISAANKSKVQAIHDHASAMGATCAAIEKQAGAEVLTVEKAAAPVPAVEVPSVPVEKAAAESPELIALREVMATVQADLTKASLLADQVSTLQADLAAAQAQRSDLEKRLAALEDQPAGEGPALTGDAILARAAEKSLGGIPTPAPAADPASTDIGRLEAIVKDAAQDPVTRQQAGRELAALRKARGPLGC